MKRPSGGRGFTASETKGFTLIEMTVVITIVALFAALVIPNLVAMKRSQDARRIKAALIRLPEEARDEARRSKYPVSLRVDGDDIVMERHPTGMGTSTGLPSAGGMAGAPAPLPSISNSAADAPEEVKRVSLTNVFSVAQARLGTDNTDLASWQWTTYPDGSSDDASLQFQSGNAIQTLILPPRGESRWVSGEEPDPTLQSWDAGELQVRVQQ